MIIHTNMNAIHSTNIMDHTANGMRKSMQKLSTGVRLNEAGDGPSDYAITEKMRVQIRGLEQARCNAENGRSLLRTAERALDSTAEILTRMKEIALEAANDTSSVSDREILQRELGHLAEALDEIAHQTQFNGITLLDGHFQNSAQKVRQAEISEMRIHSHSQENSGRNVRVWPLGTTDGTLSFTISGGPKNLLAGDKLIMKGFHGGDPVVFEFEKEDIPAQKGHVGVKIGETAEDTIKNLADAIRIASNNDVSFDLEKKGSLRINLVWTGHTKSDLENLFVDADEIFEKASGIGEYEFDLKENFKKGDTIEIAGHIFTAGGMGNESFKIGATKEESIQNLRDCLQKAAEKQIPEQFTPLYTLDKTKISNNVFNVINDIDNRVHISQITSTTEKRKIAEAVAEAVVAGKSTKEIEAVIRSMGYTDEQFGGTEVVEGLAFFSQMNQQSLFLDNFSYGIAEQIYNRPQLSVNSTEFKKAAWRSAFALLSAIGSGATKGEAVRSALDAGNRSYSGIGSISFEKLLDVTVVLPTMTVHSSGEEFLGNMVEDVLVDVHKAIPFPDDFSRLSFSAEGNTLHIKERFAEDETSLIMGSDIAPPKLTVFEEAKQPTGIGNGGLSLQIGVKSNQKIGVSIGEMSAKALGVIVSSVTDASGRSEPAGACTVDVLTGKSAVDSIDALDAAVETVAAEKAKLGAVQKRLEETMENLVIAGENVASAESVIADADMAKEMLQFQMQKILSQTGQAMIAQAATAPEQVLQLLQ